MLSRRKYIGGLGIGLCAAIATSIATSIAPMISGAGRARGAARNHRPDHRRFADRAAAMRDRAIASGDQAYGAVVVKDGTIVGLGPSRVVVDIDPTGHAEMEALRDAARHLGIHDLSGCEMFTTSVPCRMCETAAYWANIRRIYSGADASDRGKPGYGC